MAGRKGSLKASKPDEREMETRKKPAKKPAKTDAPPWDDADEDAKASDSQPDVPDWGGDGNAKAVKNSALHQKPNLRPSPRKSQSLPMQTKNRLNRRPHAAAPRVPSIYPSAPRRATTSSR